MHWQEAIAHLDKTQEIPTSDFTVRSFISVSPFCGVSSPRNSHTPWLFFTVFFELS